MPKGKESIASVNHSLCLMKCCAAAAVVASAIVCVTRIVRRILYAAGHSYLVPGSLGGVWCFSCFSPDVDSEPSSMRLEGDV